MSTLHQRKNLIANTLLKRGWNKTSIIATLCNGYQESAGTLSPTIGAFNGDGGFGIWQFTNRPNQREIINYCRTHSEKDAIIYQCNLLANDISSMWIAKDGLRWNEFVHNTRNWNWRQLTYSFMFDYERPGITHLDQRYAAYNIIMNPPIEWEGGDFDGDQTGEQPQEWHKKKYPSMSQCLSLFDKLHKNRYHTDENNNQGGGVVGGFNYQVCLDYFNRYKGSLYYSMPGRGGVFSGRSSDCSAFVSYMLEIGYGLSTRTLYNTESLHAWLKSLGYSLVESTGGMTFSKPFKAGDVIILGRIGTSLGANGHTGLCLDQNGGIYDCHFGTPALGYFNSANRFLAYHGYGGWSNWYAYHYSK